MSFETHSRRLALTRPLDLRLTLGPLRFGKGDPAFLLRYDEGFRASRTPEGPMTLHIRVEGSEVDAQAWGPGADWALEQLPMLIGEDDDIASFRPQDALIADLHARTPGLRIGASQRVFEALMPAVCSQAVSRYEARRAHRQILQELGDPAPGPLSHRITLPPDPRAIASATHQDLYLMGLDQARSDVLRRSAARAATLESLIELPTDEVERRLRSMAGVSVWTASLIRQLALGDADAVPVGDPAMKHLVAFAFLGERRGSDAQMLELLEPFRGHRGRVLRLIKAAGLYPPASD